MRRWTFHREAGMNSEQIPPVTFNLDKRRVFEITKAGLSSAARMADGYTR